MWWSRERRSTSSCWTGARARSGGRGGRTLRPEAVFDCAHGLHVLDRLQVHDAGLGSAGALIIGGDGPVAVPGVVQEDAQQSHAGFHVVVDADVLVQGVAEDIGL